MKKKNQWVRFRHRISTGIVRPFFSLIARFKYHARVDRFAGQGDRNWLILSNHQTGFDQFFVGLAFRRQVYYVATEDLFSKGWISRVISWLVAPVPFLKASTDIRAVMNCMRIAKEGGTIALFPEGNRTYSGKTCYIKPSVAALAQKLGLPIAIFRIEGGYGVSPRWSDHTRKGSMRAGVRRVIEPEEYRAMSKDELYALICSELDVDDSTSGGEYTSDTLAEGLERVIYVCPDCGLSSFATRGDVISCQKCGKRYRYLPDKHLRALDGETKYHTAAEWYADQEAHIRAMDLTACTAEPLYRDTVELSEVIIYDRKRCLQKSVEVRLYGDRLEFGDGTLTLGYDAVKAMGCIVTHKLNIFYEDKIYQLKGDRSFNALKYCNLYYHAKFEKEGHADGEFQFLGL